MQDFNLEKLQKPSRIEMFIARLRGLNLHNLKLQLKGFLKPTSCISLSYRIDVFDKNHNFIKTTGERPCHSFVIGFLKSLEYWMGHPYGLNGLSIPIVDSTGNTINIYNYGTTGITVHAFHYNGALENASGVVTYGVQVGNGAFDPISVDFALNGPLAHGIGANQLQYGASGVSSVFIGSNFIILPIMRMVTNASGSSIDITELGLMEARGNPSASAIYILWIKDHFSAIPLASGAYALIYFHIRTEL